jgi:hypothetical protein
VISRRLLRDSVVSVDEGIVQGSEETEQPSDELRSLQENELAVSYALASMEYALAHEAFHVGSTMREAGIVFDPLTFVALRILEASASEIADPPGLLSALADNGSLDRSVELATDWLAEEAA